MDSSSASGWRSQGDIRKDALLCESVGFLVGSNKDTNVLALILSDPEQCSKPIGDTITIPTKCIVNMRTLK